MQQNFLKATIVNTFIDIMLHPENYDFSSDLLSPDSMKQVSEAIYNDVKTSCDKYPDLAAEVQNLGDGFSSTYVANVLNRCKRTSPYTMADVEYATQAGIDILSSSIIPDLSNSPILKANLNTGDTTGLRIEETLEKAECPICAAKQSWLEKYKQKKEED